jgi:hypothetical protein
MASTIQTVLTRLLQVAPIPSSEKEELQAVVDAAFVAAPAVATVAEDVATAVPSVVATVKTDSSDVVTEIRNLFDDLKSFLSGHGPRFAPNIVPAPPSVAGVTVPNVGVTVPNVNVS